MTELEEIKAKIGILEDKEAIKELRAKYWRCFDKKLWDEMTECYSEDAAVEFGAVGRFEGKKAIMEYLRTGSLSASPSTTVIHHGHSPVIKINSDTKATGIWQMYSYATDTETNRGRRIIGFYYDEYTKENGEWKMKSTDADYMIMEEFDLNY